MPAPPHPPFPSRVTRRDSPIRFIRRHIKGFELDEGEVLDMEQEDEEEEEEEEGLKVRVRRPFLGRFQERYEPIEVISAVTGMTTRPDAPPR